MDVDAQLVKLNVAFARLTDAKDENFALQYGLIRQVGRRAWGVHEEHGFQTAWLYAESHRLALAPPSPPRDVNGYVQLVRAFLTPIDEGMWQHILERLAWGGNVVAQVTGPTGMAKSSVTLGLMNKIKPIPPERLDDFLVFDMVDLPPKLAKAKPGDSILIDEYIRQAGEGSRTFAELLQNLEDTIRASGVNLFWLSPESKDHGTSQFEIQIFSWNRESKQSRALVWVNGAPLGHVTLDWAPDELWTPYSVWKSKNVGRSQAGAFRDKSSLARRAMDLVANESFVRYVEFRGKPNKQMVSQAVGLFAAQQMTVRTQDDIAHFIHDCGYGWDAMKGVFAELFGLQPHANMARIAKICYKE